MRWWVVLFFVVFAIGSVDARPVQRDPGLSFPMPASDFKKVVEGRFVTFKARLETMMKNQNVAEAKRVAARKKAETLHQELIKKVDQLGADKQITQDEARQVRQMAIRNRLAVFKEAGLQPPKRRAPDDDD